MSRIAIIGAGISGPAAALALATAGHQVTVYEQRRETELKSFGVIGITNDNWVALNALGVYPWEYPAEYTVYGGKTTPWDGHYVMWTNLHNELVTAARHADASVDFRFNSRWQAGTEDADYRIMAAGVGYAATNNAPHYTGYVVYRGLSALDTNYSWLSVSDDVKRWNFKLAYTQLGAAWELYAHQRVPRPMGTTSVDVVSPHLYRGLPEQFVSYITRSPEIYRAAISDWDVPESLFNGTRIIQIGDANGAMRPHTGMGANLAIDEALHLPDLIDGTITSRHLITSRQEQHDRGIVMGQEVLGV